MSRKKKEISKTLNEVIRVKISDRSNYNNIFLVDDKEELLQVNTDGKKTYLSDKEVNSKILNGKIKTSKAIQRSKILINESELIRILKTLNPKNNNTDGSDYPFVKDLVILKVGRGFKKYSDLIYGDELAILYVNGIKYKRFICTSGHNRAKKAMFIREELYDKVFDILMCGIDPDDSNNKVLPCKQNAYFGLPATDSIVVSMPNIVVVPDYKKNIEQEYDVVYGDISKSEYEVKLDEKRLVEILPFDGAGLIDKDKAQEWAKELKLDYLPASWQVRCIPAIKGNLFVFDIKKFSETYGVTKITDVWGDTWDLINNKIDCIMTESQWKYWKMYSSFADWKKAFETDLYGYCRTFNISEYAVACRKPSETSKSRTLKNTTLLSYQPLQTLQFTKEEIETLCNQTIEDIKQIHLDVDAFLRFRGLEDNEDINWNQVPPYYKALKYNHALFNDSYIKGQIENDLKNIKIRACAGKLRCRGNYQTLTPDIFGLAQWAFGIEPTGLLNADEIFSAYWNNQIKNDLVYVPNGIKYSPVKAQVSIKELDLIRSPHVANEHCPVLLVNTENMQEWYKYQKTGYLLSMYDTNMLKMNSADTDGDHIMGVCDDTIIAAAKRCKANTIYFKQMDAGTPKEQKKRKSKRMKQPNDLKALMLSDVEGYKNNIGTVVNDTSILWSLPQEGEIPNYIKIMSVIDSLVIDFVKTGITATIPENIKKELKKHKKPYFMKYTKKSNLLADRRIKRNSKMFGVEDQPKFEDSNCTMNNICHYMEENLKDLKVNPKITEEFDFTSLLTGEWDDFYSEKYRDVRNKLFGLQEEFNKINRDKFHDKDDSTDAQQDSIGKFRQFYAYAKNELLLVQPDIQKLINDLVTIYYTDKQFISKDNKSILWNCFPSEMIKIAKGKTVKNKTLDLTVLEERQKKFSKNKAKKKNKQINIKCLIDTPSVVITKPEIKEIKKKIEKVESRRYFFILLVIWRKLNSNRKKEKSIQIKSGVKNQINYSTLSTLSGIDNRHTDQIIADLQSCGVIEVDLKNIETPKIKILFPIIKGETSKEIDSIDKCKDYINHAFPIL